MGRELILTDQGQIVFREAKANGVLGIALRAPTSLAANLTWTLPATLPGGTEFLTIDASGQLGVSTGSVASLDGAYDTGSVITADAGPVEAAGAGGFLASHSAPTYGLETTGLERNYRLTAGQTAGIFEVQVGGSDDGDISDDTFGALLALDGANRRLGVGTVAPGTLGHLLAPAGTDAKLTLEAPAAQDASVVFTEASTARFEIGYDDSAGGLVVGRLSFANPAVFVEDATGDIGINELTPDAKLHVKSAENLTAEFESTDAIGACSLALVSDATTDNTKVRISAFGDDLRLYAGSTKFVHLDGVDGNFGIATSTPTAKLEVLQSANDLGLLINQDANGESLRIDSEATSLPLINLLPIDGNSRGDITAASTGRANDPASPSDGDIWYNGLSKRWKARASGKNVPFTHVLGPTWRTGVQAAISGGAIAITSVKEAHIILQAQTGTTDDLDTLTLTGSSEFQEGDTVLLRADSGDTITVKHGTGNIVLDGSADKALTNNNMLILMRVSSSWHQLTPMMVLP